MKVSPMIKLSMVSLKMAINDKNPARCANTRRDTVFNRAGFDPFIFP